MIKQKIKSVVTYQFLKHNKINTQLFICKQLNYKIHLRSKQMQKNTNQKQVKHLNTQSFRDKTQKAIQLINKHESQKYDLLKTLAINRKFLNLPSLLSKNQDQQYFNIVQIPEIKLQQSIKVQLLPYTDQIYKLKNPFYKFQENKQSGKQQASTNQKQSNFQLNKSFVQEKKNFNNHSRQDKLKIYFKNYRGSTVQILFYFLSDQNQRNFGIYSHKYLINSQKIINIYMEQVNKKYVYMRFKSNSELSMFTLRVQQEHFVMSKMKTQANQLNQSQKRINKSNSKLKKNKLKNINQKSQNEITLQRQVTQASQVSKQIKQENLQKTRSYSLRQLPSIYKNEVSLAAQQKQSVLIKKPTKQILQKQKQQQKKRKQLQQKQKLQQIILKKESIQTAKQKQQKLKSMALQMKKLVQAYRLIHQAQQKQIKHIIPKLAALVLLPKFHIVCSQIIQERQRGINIALKTRILTKRFVKALKRKYRESLQCIKNKKARAILDVIGLTTMVAKKSYDVVFSVIQNCDAGLRLNLAFDKATQYRRSVRIIQKAWRSKYTARMIMFETYVRDQSADLYVKYPHFKHLQSKFQYEKTAHILAYKYVSDESSKFKYLIEDYQQRMNEIKQFKQMNQKIAQFNKTALKKRQKQYLQIPKTPCFPVDRYFRNISFLKSLVRGWYQLQYRKWAKASKNSLQSPQSLIKQTKGSKKKL